MRFTPVAAWISRVIAATTLLVPALHAAPAAAASACSTIISSRPPGPVLAAYRPLRAAVEAEVGLTYLGHSSFLIETPGGVTIVTDYNGYLTPASVPDVVTMNHAHPSHYTDNPDPGIKLVLRGWDTGSGVPNYDVKFGDVRIRSVPTNIRTFSGGTEYAGNSIFIFDTADLCIAHLGHLHHTLTPEHLAALGQIDVLLTPIDGAFTLSHLDMIEVIDEIHPALVVPMHYFARSVLDRFIERVRDRYKVHLSETASVSLSRATLPKATEVLVLPGG